MGIGFRVSGSGFRVLGSEFGRVVFEKRGDKRGDHKLAINPGPRPPEPETRTPDIHVVAGVGAVPVFSACLRSWASALPLTPTSRAGEAMAIEE